MSKRMGGAENANDLLSSKSCLRDVVVGVSSSKLAHINSTLKQIGGKELFLFALFMGRHGSYNVFIKIINLK